MKIKTFFSFSALPKGLSLIGANSPQKIEHTAGNAWENGLGSD